MDYIKSNINNLTSIWEIVGNTFNTLHKDSSYNYCYVPGSDWPNRVWVAPGTGAEGQQQAIEAVKRVPLGLTYSHWRGNSEEESLLLKNSGLVIKSEQVGMSMHLKELLPVAGRLQLIPIREQAQADIWEALYPQSFGYKISAETVLKTAHLIPYFLIYLNEEPIGTILSIQTGDVIGIHCLGVIPAHRRKGYAEEAMAMALNEAIKKGITWATLQASQLGKGIYSRMGFTDDFMVTNYHLPPREDA
ncbi:GNAT family N-acetyltransferase [Chitinophaga sp. Hz27]|uniref:GNAT family N-acetyltransferase n=1 Tax=Chitinophaga sp. Hz27 TaxID=3347169 RepID=UPI0035D9D793